MWGRRRHTPAESRDLTTPQPCQHVTVENKSQRILQPQNGNPGNGGA